MQNQLIDDCPGVVVSAQWDGDFIAIPEIYHASQVEVYEEITGILLGLVCFLDPHLLRNDVVRVPLRDTCHWGMTFEKEEKFEPIGICKYVELKVETFYFNGGKSKKRCLWVDHAEWLALCQERKRKV